MKRRDFIFHSCATCLGLSIFPLTISGCAGTRYVSGTMETDGLSVLQSEFSETEKSPGRQFIIVSNEKLEYPIYLFKNEDSSYKALWMMCSHQGTELLAAGDHLVCPAHGSEFNHEGKATQGPAENNLRTFNVRSEADKLIIELK
ncbi:MAG: Rieske 2Fe-2S domain-containing protein [Flammeovirgaceae bacterium]|nr:Rieske 2Fe-2S domain-containing protein [Flammeovirgaceae bacterium]